VSVSVALGLALVPGCAPMRSGPAAAARPHLGANAYTSFDGSVFPYRKWLPAAEPRLVVIGFHGIAGASSDLDNLGRDLRSRRPATAVYAPDLRGQGYDPIVSRRGDIRDPGHWFHDARTFSHLVRRRHPDARLVWFGESMGALIALHAMAAVSPGDPPAEALILSSPVVRLRGLPPSMFDFLRIAAAIAPGSRTSLEALTGVDQVQLTRDTIHEEQVLKNPYHISEFTLRFYRTLVELVEGMPGQAERIRTPVLILHGGRDLFSHPADVASFASRFHSASGVQRAYLPESHHLLFYDHQREQALDTVSNWLRGLTSK